MAKEYQFLWKWDLKSSPDELWFMASDTNRFNKDTWQPPMQILGIENGVRHVRYRIPLIRMEWEEEPFEWIFPNSFGVLRRYSAGPLVEMRIDTKLEPLPGGGTQILYGTTIKPSHFLIGILVPFGIGVVAKRLFERAFRKYDRIAAQGEPLANTMTRHGLRPAGQARFKTLSESVISQGSDPKLVQRLEEFLDKADDLSLQHIRAYGLADRWNFDRRAVLEMCLRATRAGILDMSWDLLCPSCRGAAETATNLSTVHAASHCETCNIDFTANFDHNVEVVFHVNPSIRAVDTTLEFCVGSPQRQPHIVVNQSLLPREEVAFSTHLDAGRYTAKASGLSGSRSIAAMSDGEKSFELLASYDGWPYGEAHISLAPRLRLLNITQEPQAFKIERTIWSDQASTAADVTTLQVFRDLFATEVLRPGEDLSVGSVTLMFTDLLDSTRLYRQIGDPSAFGRVRDHFVILEAAVAAEGGGIIKTMGDSVMAAFQNPAAALRAIMTAQKSLGAGEQGVWLKIGIHQGSCIVVNQNDRLDYFGSTVNIAARLPDFSLGGEVIFSESIRNDPEVIDFLNRNVKPDALTRFSTEIKGYEEPFPLWRLKI